MSAIAGLWNFDGKPGAGHACTTMLAALTSYGPHDGAQWSDAQIALGRRLYRTLPEDVHDRQPIVGAGGGMVLVADLRLDNRDELIRSLDLPVDRARTLADSAILFAAWERWREQCFDRLVGDYAFAAWDARERRLVLARDPLGTRPLNYHASPSWCAFASMPTGLHALPAIPRVPDEERAAEFLALLPESTSRSFFAGVERVEPGCYVVVTPRGITPRRHWDPPRRVLALASADEYAEALRHHLDEAVRARLRGAAGRVGAHLSAGFDSSAVAATAARLLAPTGGTVTAFTSVPRVGFAGRAPYGALGDEGPIAAATAAMYNNIDHILVRTADWTLARSLDRNFELYQRPMLNVCNGFWIDAIRDSARARDLAVFLTGQMGNMTVSYGGETLLPRLFRTGRWLRLLREGYGLARNGMRVRGVLARTLLPLVNLSVREWIEERFKGGQGSLERYSALHPDRAAQLDRLHRADARIPDADGFDARLWVLRRLDLGHAAKGSLAGWGIDQRDPTTDRRLVELCLSVPADQFLVDGTTKALARRAFADRLPGDVIHSRRKGYQAVDWHERLTTARSDIAAELDRLESCPAAARTIDLPRLRGLVGAWPTSGWDTPEVTTSYRLLLLRAISTGHFLRRATDRGA